ncbi:ATP-binding protein, partial [Streptomyces sp. IBSBF 2953]|nr:ATP-binding protein [Streptomyces hayashii]
DFNPWLNSIIGGRGSGKSSLLEFLRLATGRGIDLMSLPKGNEVKDSFERFVKKSLSRDDDGVMQDGTVVKVELMKQGARYKLIWRFGTVS